MEAPFTRRRSGGLGRKGQGSADEGDEIGAPRLAVAGNDGKVRAQGRVDRQEPAGRARYVGSTERGSTRRGS
jgi:hypothetical protein